MSIWKVPANLETIQTYAKEGLIAHLNIQYTEIGEDFLVAEMPVTEKVLNPIGKLHGGASCVLAETCGSIAANLAVDPLQHYCLGLDINTSHITSVCSGTLIAKASALKIGKLFHVWQIPIHHNTGRLVSYSRLTMFVRDKPQKT